MRRTERVRRRASVASSDATVFLVDDDASVRKATARLLRSAGLHIEMFATALEFLERGRPNTPGCLVLDVRMPGLTGLELQAELAKHDMELPIVFISGYGDVPTSVEAMKKGAIDFLLKPFNDHDLVDAVRRAIEVDARSRHERAERAEIQHRFDLLTPREREVLALVVTGMLNKQIGSQLGTSEKTVKVHRGRVMKKMQAGSVAELVRLASALSTLPETGQGAS